MTYGFRRLAQADLPLVWRWLDQPHVIAWWGDPDEQFDLVSEDISDPRIDEVLMLLDERRIGYAQSWAPEDWAGHPFADQPAGTRGIDPFIGEADLVGQGHGSRFVRDLSDRLLAAGTPRVMIDTDPANLRAVRAYGRAGFRTVETRETDDGPALLMIREPGDPR